MEKGREILDFRKKVREKQQQIPDKVFFLSKECLSYLENLCEAVCKLYNNTLKLHLKWTDEEDVAFATDKYSLTLNLNNQYMNGAPDRISKLVLQKGIVLHECGHILFTDFHLIKSAVKVFLDQRKLFPEPKCEEYKEWLTDAALFDDEVLSEWIMVWKRLENSIEDSFIEQKILKLIPGEGQCLYSLRDEQMKAFKPIKVQKNDGLDNPSILFNSILSLAKYNTVKMDADDTEEPAIKALLNSYDLINEAVAKEKSYDRLKLINEIFCKLYKFMKEDKERQEQEQNSENSEGDTSCEQDNTSDNSQAQEQSQEEDEEDGENQTEDNEDNQQSPESQQQTDSESGSKQQDEGGQQGQQEDGNSSQSSDSGNNGQSSQGDSSDNSDNGQTQNSGSNTSNSNSQSGSGKPSPSSLLQNAPAEMKDQIDTGSASVLNDRNIDQQPFAPASNKQEKIDNLLSKPEPDAQIPTPSDKRTCESIGERIAENEVKKEEEERLCMELKDEVANFDFTNINRNCEVDIVRNYPSSAAVELYEKEMQEIRFLAKKTVNEIKNKIKDHQQGGKINGLYQGRYLDQHSLSRFDMRVLAKNDLPEDIPNMAISVLIDASGSMGGEKEVYARRTALLLYHFGQELHIPVMVYAHNKWYKVTMNALADFGSVDGNDKYRICDLTSHGCNRDGMALRFCSEKLAKRPEETKIMFVISDGRPSDYNSAKEADSDIKNVLLDYSKKNVKYITFGLGTDQKGIKELYTQDLSPKVAAKFIKTDEPSALPVAIVRAIKELIKV